MVLHKLIGFDHFIVAVSLKRCYNLFIIWHLEFWLVLVLLVQNRPVSLESLHLDKPWVLGDNPQTFFREIERSVRVRFQKLVDIPPVFVFLQSLRQALLILVLWYRKWPPSVSLVPTAISYAGWAMLYNEE